MQAAAPSQSEVGRPGRPSPGRDTRIWRNLGILPRSAHATAIAWRVDTWKQDRHRGLASRQALWASRACRSAARDERRRVRARAAHSPCARNEARAQTSWHVATHHDAAW